MSDHTAMTSVSLVLITAQLGKLNDETNISSLEEQKNVEAQISTLIQNLYANRKASEAHCFGICNNYSSIYRNRLQIDFLTAHLVNVVDYSYDYL